MSGTICKWPLRSMVYWCSCWLTQNQWALYTQKWMKGKTSWRPLRKKSISLWSRVTKLFFSTDKALCWEGKDEKMPSLYPLHTNHGGMRCLHYVVSTCCCPRSVAVHRRRNQGKLFFQYYVLSSCCFLHRLSQVWDWLTNVIACWSRGQAWTFGSLKEGHFVGSHLF